VSTPSGAPVADCGMKLCWSAGGECEDRACGRKFVRTVLTQRDVAVSLPSCADLTASTRTRCGPAGVV
jgi:hypothetical protein